MTNQQIFDRVLTHLRAQGQAAAIADGDSVHTDYDCRYRLTNDDGRMLMCAAGCLIPDIMYSPEMEGTTARHGLVLTVLDEALGLKSNPEFIRQYTRTWDLIGDLQATHDGELANHGMDRWESRMEVIASEYCLSYIHPHTLPA